MNYVCPTCGEPILHDEPYCYVGVGQTPMHVKCTGQKPMLTIQEVLANIRAMVKEEMGKARATDGPVEDE